MKHFTTGDYNASEQKTFLQIPDMKIGAGNSSKLYLLDTPRDNKDNIWEIYWQQNFIEISSRKDGITYRVPESEERNYLLMWPYEEEHDNLPNLTIIKDKYTPSAPAPSEPAGPSDQPGYVPGYKTGTCQDWDGYCNPDKHHLFNPNGSYQDSTGFYPVDEMKALFEHCPATCGEFPVNM